jgi:hypothetical protein
VEAAGKASRIRCCRSSSITHARRALVNGDAKPRGRRGLKGKAGIQHWGGVAAGQKAEQRPEIETGERGQTASRGARLTYLLPQPRCIADARRPSRTAVRVGGELARRAARGAMTAGPQRPAAAPLTSRCLTTSITSCRAPRSRGHPRRRYHCDRRPPRSCNGAAPRQIIMGIYAGDDLGAELKGPNDPSRARADKEANLPPHRDRKLPGPPGRPSSSRVWN